MKTWSENIWCNLCLGVNWSLAAQDREGMTCIRPKYMAGSLNLCHYYRKKMTYLKILQKASILMRFIAV